jgi:cystathionine beta-lyase/cystathionine gamma-synthase
MSNRSIFTSAVHAGERLSQPAFTPVATPIYPSVGYVYPSMAELDDVFAGKISGPVYARFGNPTNNALESAVAELEGGEAALSCASGMAAIHTALLAAGAGAGRWVVAAQDVYGATFSLLQKLFSTLGVQSRFVDACDLTALAAAVTETHPAAVIAETVSNPLLKVADLPAIAQIAHASGANLIVDNTFATPFLCRPLSLGADYVIHSSTKYLGGHGDVLGGIVVCSAARRQALNEIFKLTGANLGPQEAWLTLRGLKTLPLRMERQCANAMRVAEWLSADARIAHVNFPGLSTHPQHALTGRLFGYGLYGAMISFDLKEANGEAVYAFMDRLRMIVPATTLGDVYTLVLYPAGASHRSLDPAYRRSLGIGDGLVRLSVGIEAVEDIIEDLNQAL